MKQDLKLQMDKMEKLLCRLLWSQLYSMGWLNGTEIYTSDLKTKTRISDLYDKWLVESIAVLTRNNFLRDKGSSVVVTAPAPIDLNAEWREWERQISPFREDPNLKSRIDLVQATVRMLPEILTGKIPAADIVFRNSFRESVVGNYQNNAADLPYEVLADTVSGYIRERLAEDPFARISIIEIDAGVGDTSAVVLQKLKPYREHIREYCYTDSSKTFFKQAEIAYGTENPYFTCQIFDPETPVAGQGIGLGGYDLAIAANMLHATKNIRQTIQNIKATLQKNGLLLINALSRNSLFLHLTFGLLAEWWLFEDPELRIPGSPVLSAQTWQTVLEQEGFRPVFFPAQPIPDPDQQVIVAESDGVITQEQSWAGGSGSRKGEIVVEPTREDDLPVGDRRKRAFEYSPSASTASPLDIPPDLLREKATVYIKKLVGEILKIPGHKIDSAAPFENYGIDSIMVVQLTSQFAKTLTNINSTLFFEYQTIDALVEYFIRTRKDSLITLLGLAGQEDKEEASTVEEKPVLPLPKRSDLRRIRRFGTPDDLKIPTSRVQDIAVIGLSGRYSGANNVDEFWRNLAIGRDCITEIPEERWDYNRYYDEDKNKPGKTYSKWGGFIEGANQFDPLFFNISPREAEIMDPQERLFLECVYATLEDAGYTRETLRKYQGMGLEGNIGVYVGVMYEEYQLYGAQAQSQGYPMALSGNPSSIANRVSYFCNFHGPSVAIDTMCSSSLTAIYLACQGIQRGSCELAIAGGVNVSIHPNKYLGLAQGKFVSSKGRCESFGQGGDGYVPGEGVGAILMKPFAKAIADGDQIYGVIKGTAVNHSGKTNGYTVPNPNAQAGVIRQALQEAGVDPRTISYIEAHGTGTSLGDPIEITGLAKAFQEYTANKQFCAIGSAKSNIGHCESAAGIAGVTKVLLQLKHQQIAPSLHSEILNPNIDFINTPFIIPQTLMEWVRPLVTIDGITREYPRLAGISSFGAGGANAHIIIEEYSAENQAQPSVNVILQIPAIIVLSAKNEARLKERVRQLLTFIREAQFTDAGLADIAYTLQVGREAMEERIGIIADTIGELVGKLEAFLAGQDGIEDLYHGQVKRNQETLAILTADEEMRETIQKWIERKKYEKLLTLWVKGLVFDWQLLYGENKPRRISLPTYPFARERYWVPEFEPRTEEVKPVIPIVTKSPKTEKAVLIKDWQPKELKLKRDKLTGIIMVLGTEKTGKLALSLFQDRETIQVIKVFHGESEVTGEIATDFYSASAGAEAYRQIKEQLTGAKLTGVIDITAYDEQYEQSTALEAGKLVFLQKLLENERQQGFCIIQVTYRLNNLENTKTTMQGARLAGLYRMLGTEYQQIKSLTMDTDCSLDFYKKAAKQIQTEFCIRAEGNYSEACYRNDLRYEPVLRIAQTEQEIEVEHRVPLRYQPEEVVIITGGSRGIGAAIAGHIVSQGVKNLIIIGREKLPEQSEWKTVIAKPENLMLTEKLKRLQSYIEHGVKVRYYDTSLRDEAGIRAMVEQIHQELGPITGVFHCAGLTSTTPVFFEKPLRDIELISEPKMSGLVTLHQTLAEEPLSFFILFSSISGVAPALAVGQSDYAMANAYMDYYAIHQTGQGKTYIKSLQWPAWKETGMAAGGMNTPNYLNSGLVAHRTADGLKLLEIIKQGTDPVSIPCVMIPDQFNPNQLLQPKLIPFKQESAHIITQTPALTTNNTTHELRPIIREWLRDIFITKLKLCNDQWDSNKAFDEYGVDSVILAGLAATMQERVKQPLDPSLLLQFQTAEALTDYFVSHHGAVFDETGEFQQATQLYVETDNETTFDPSFEPARREPGLEYSEIAIIGIACRFPDSPDKEAYWDLLTQGISAIKPVPAQRWSSPENRPDYGGWIDEIDRFDAGFFNINEKDAAAMDPQARVILEESLKAIYDAGYEPKQLSGQKIGVYIGGRLQPNLDMTAIIQAPNPVLGMGQNYIASNISRFFNFTGPSMVIDTACSSGLTGMSIAIEALQGRRIEMALAGAVNLLLNPNTFELFKARNILSKNGEVHIFEEQSGGEVLGEGAGVVILKRLNDAIRDGNRIYGVIKAIAVNNDGRTIGPGSPNLNAQKQVIREALALSGKTIEEIGYIEVNGGGSPVVDAVEIKSLAETYHLDNQALGPCYLGSIKPNIGHLLLTSGMAELIRCVLSVYHKQIPLFLSAKAPFPYYDFGKSRIRFNRETITWEVPDGQKRVAALNSFPDGGTNCHLIIEEFVPDVQCYQPIVLPKELPVMAKKVLRMGGPLKPNEQKPEIFNTNWGEFFKFNNKEIRFIITNDSPFVKNHSVQGKPILPGLAYIDMIYQVAKIFGLDVYKTVLRNLTIFNPLIIEADFPVELIISFSENQDDWEILVEGLEKRVTGISDQNRKKYVSALLHHDEFIGFNQTIEVAKIKKESRTIIDPETAVYTPARQNGLVHQGIMKPGGAIYLTDEDCITELMLADNQADDTKGYLFHPALIDGSAMVASITIQRLLPKEIFEAKNGLSLPIFFEAFSANELINAECYTRVPVSSVEFIHDIGYCDIEFYNSEGKQVGILKRLTSKRVRSEEQFSTAAVKKTLPQARHLINTTVQLDKNKPNSLQQKVINIFSRYLSLQPDQIDPQLGFFDLGLESVHLLEIVKELELLLNTTLNPTLMFEYSSIQELITYFEKEPGVQPEFLEPENIRGIANQKLAFKSQQTLEGPKLPELEIAVIGVSGRYPQARNLDQFWQNLRDGKDCITEIPKERWDHSRYFDEDQTKPGKIYTKWGGFLEGVDEFDPLFFNISPQEAECLDPQERLFLECVYETLEDAGYTRKNLTKNNCLGLGGNVGVFVGVMYEEYQLYGVQSQVQGFPIALSGSPASIGNRVSYFCNFHGPSIAVDSMCSSSLTAIHLACQSIRRGECELAIAGGVNVSIHPNKYLMLAQGKFASSKGRCESFGLGGDGYVPGEGVGAVLLKPLFKAIAAGDQVYGIIKGTAINHGGKTSGYTVPNPGSQAEVIGLALAEAGIDPRMISYIEAHGTGTSLGDPIEIAGLTKAFQKYTKDRQFCAIGSAKSNIGHCESAAGIAGVTKVLLQLKNHQIVPSLHSEVLNSNIDFNNTPFIVQQTLTEWVQPVVMVGRVTKECPRIAGISAFGAGGSNAHIIIQEFIRQDQEQALITNTPLNPAMIVLSAKNKERLQEQAERLLAAIRERGLADANPADIAYTLQVGREAMEERLGFIISSTGELAQKLEAFLAGQNDIESVCQGRAKQEQEALAIFASDEDLQKAVESWINKGKYFKLLDLWVKGLEFDWGQLYGEKKPRRISLPPYPFAKERYWVPELEIPAIAVTNTGISTYIHPLLHQNISDLTEQRYSSTFTGKEFFLADHIVNGQKVLPEVAVLEMARAAVELAAGVEADQTGIWLKDIIWDSPIIVTEETIQVNIGLYPVENEIGFEIYSATGNEDSESLVYGRGRARLTPVTEIPVLDLQTVQAECNRRIVPADQVYDAFKTIGIEYGPGYQGIEQIYVGQGQVLAKLSLPSRVAETHRQFILHPSMMEAALQASIGLSTRLAGTNLTGNNTIKPLLPCALRELQVFGTGSPGMWAWIRTNEENTVWDKVRILDIDICDEQGNVRTRLKGLETKEYSESNPQNEFFTEPQEPYELMTFEEAWQEQKLPEASPVKLKTIVCFLSNPENQQQILATFAVSEPQMQIVFISQSNSYQRHTSQSYSICRADRKTYEEAFRSIHANYEEISAVLYLWALEEPGCIKDYSCMAYILQVMAISGLRTRRILMAANFEINSLDSCYAESWIGFERSLGMIFPNTQIAALYQATGPDQGIVMKDWGRILREELQIPKVQSALYQGGKRYIYQIRPITIAAGNSLLKKAGTYLITGGCGGLGFQFAKFIAQKHPVNLVLMGRSAIDAEIQKKIKVLEELGSQVMYLQTDVCNSNAMRAKVKQARERFGVINGVIHAAGILGTHIILEKENEEFQKVIAPKITGTQALDKVLGEEPLDFICYFSSSSAILGDFGACDYASGNRFQMAYAHYRNWRTSQGLTKGKAIVINWPLWKDGGMGFGNDNNNMMYLKTSGQRFLETDEGVAIFDRILGQNGTQFFIITGQPSRVHRFLGLTEERPVTSPVVDSSLSEKRRRVEMKGLSVKQCLEWDLKGYINRLLKIPREKIDLQKNLADFGFNSVGLTQLALQITKNMGIETTPALFFGYPTVKKLAQYYLEKYPEIVGELYREADGAAIEKVVQAQIPVRACVGPQGPKIKRTRYSMNTVQNQPEPIAVIGMSGRFPGADNIDELWTVLAAGQDIVREIPPERFDWREYYGDPSKEPGKTNCKWCGCISGVNEFDPLFFEISPREAETMDPRQRLLLQESWKALEDAGYGPEQIKSQKIGMFVGAEQGDYQFLTLGEGEISANNNAILAARLAYFLNLNGPVMAIDTACSSGLVAAHQAILSLRTGECNTAIVAGVNLLLTPWAFIGTSQAGMLSDDGKCFTFDKRANGMVPGEAVAVVVLKPLFRAQADGDPIYAVIKGSGINYDGKTNGITAPSGVSQTALLKNVYDQYQVNPEDIEYIVTHGTGTKLGDPIEINALYDTFKGYTKQQGYCALTSTKTNLGHTFAVSGLVSLIGLIQAMRHQTIPASLHCEQENDYINWQESPFFINKTNKQWLAGGRTLTGAVSAFGMSGTNAHMVVQSYDATNERVLPAQAPYYLLVFSAKTEESLAEKINMMIEVLQNKDMPAQNLAQIGYTLLEGRQHFQHRCAIVIQDREDAVYVLKQFGGREKLPNLFRGNVPGDFTMQEVIEQYVQELVIKIGTVSENKLEYQKILRALADFYCQGYQISWKWLYQDVKPQRIHLPTYPFMRESYWVTAKNGFGSITSSAVQANLHPLLHQNTSNLSGQRFSSTFTGEEFFIKDYMIQGRSGLSGAASLEIARIAVTTALDTTAAIAFKNGQAVIELKDIIWVQPALFMEEKPVQVHIRLFLETSGEIVYQIYSSIAEDNAPAETEPIVYCQGRAAMTNRTEPLKLDLNAVKAKCNQGILSSAQIYDLFKTIGIEYGAGYQAIDQMYIGVDQVLAKLVVPTGLSEAQDQYFLQPSLIEAAFQVATRFMIGPNGAKLLLPMALKGIEIMDRCTSGMWAVIQYNQSDKTKIDIDLCDAQGSVMVKMKGYSTREWVAEETNDSIKPLGSTIKKMLFQIDWKEQAVAKTAPVPKYNEHLVILCEMGDHCTPEQLQEKMRTGNNLRCLALHSKESEIDKRFQYHTIRVFEELRTIFRDKPDENIFIQIVYVNQGEKCLFAGLSGLLNTARMENPQVTGQLIEIEPGENPAEIAAKLEENRRAPSATIIRYQTGRRLISGLSQIEVSLEETSGEIPKPWKDRGIYLITGGTGGLGLIFAKEIAASTKEAVIVLTGRSSLNPAKKARLKEIEAIGAKIIYAQVNVTDKKGVQDLVERIAKEYGGLNGIIHSAGFFRDNFILKKTKEEIKEVLAPKVTGLINLDEASRELKLDFLILFSSTAVNGNPGQADYATANAFMDTYAGYRNNLTASNQRHGQTMAINWPFWKEGGMQVNAEIEKLWLSMGMVALETQTGIRALYQGLLSGNDQVIVVVEDYIRIEALNLSQQSDTEPVTKLTSAKGRRPELRGLSLEQCLEWELKYIINRLLKIPREKIDSKKNLMEFGFNSIGLTQFAIQLNKHFGIIELTPASFFKYSTIEKLSQYFLTKCRATIEEFYREGISEPNQIESPKSPKYPDIVPLPKSMPESHGNRFGFKIKDMAPDVLEPIAVIGMSGRFPNADSVQELWSNLRNGKNCITEIPKERWDWRDCYGDSVHEPNKTNSKWGGFIRDIGCFDPRFFEMGPKEAEFLDPRQRLFLEEAWHCLEDAGYMGERIQGKRCGVYAGIDEGEYNFLNNGAGFSGSNQNATLPARIAYKLDLRGPNLALTATCSSGLVAVHHACQALRQGDCEMALAGGATLLITPILHIVTSQAGINSPDGKCYVFDQRANGMVPGEAVALVLLKPLSKAILDQDHIYGCIKASGVNYNGKGNGMSAPNPLSQAELIQNIYDKYQIHPETIQYIIPHSSGTKLGDSIEIQVLSEVFGQYTDKKQYCAIGSIKPLIGHTFAASGIVSLISMIMSIKNETILATSNYEISNEYINFKDSPFQPNRENQKWTPPNNQPRMGIISTTGTNGTNAHAVIEEYRPVPEKELPSETSPQIILLSAKNQDRLRAVIQQMLEFVEQNKEIPLSDMAYTLQVGREAMASRFAVVVNNKQELTQGLRAYLDIAKGAKKIKTFPYYTGDLDSDSTEMRELLSGKVADTIVEMFLKEKNLEKIAHYWTKGGKIPWESIHEGETVRIISLPAYPFAREHYWLSTTTEIAVPENPEPDLNIKVEAHLYRENKGPRNEIEAALAEIFEDVLQIASVNVDDNFFKLGGNSLSVVKALELIKERLHQKIHVKDFYSYSTVENLGQMLKNGRAEEEAIDLNREAILEVEIRPCGEITAPSHQTNIFLTGCTGFIGKFLLHELLQKTEATIYCMVRAGSKLEAMKRIKASLREFELWEPEYERRIIAVAGDLSQPDLGIAPNTYRKLSVTIDAIYHCATYMSHLATYREMKNTTVDGAKRILKFACTGKQKMIQYISTLGIFNGNPSRVINETTAIEQEIHYNSAGYAAGKWVAEKIMMLARERGIPSNIYRLGMITGDSKQGRYEKTQLFYRIWQTYLELGCFNYDPGENKHDMTPVDFVSEAIVYLAHCPEINRIYHLSNDQMVGFADVIDFYNTGAEKPLTAVSFPEFYQKVKEAQQHGKVLPIVPILGDLPDLSNSKIQALNLNTPDLYSNRKVDSAWTQRILKEGGILMPEIDMMLIKKYFEYIWKNIRSAKDTGNKSMTNTQVD